MANPVVVRFPASSGNTTWVAPAEVKYVRVHCTRPLTSVVGDLSGAGAMAFDPLGNAFAWGEGGAGQCWQGNGTNASNSSPLAVLGALDIVQAIVAEPNAFWLTRSGALYGSGDNTTGQLGIGSTVAVSTPTAVQGGKYFSSIYKQGGFSGSSIFALNTSGVLYSWGDNHYGQLGIGSVLAQSFPIAVSGGNIFSSVFPSYGEANENISAMYALTPAGQAYAWTNNSNGQLGVGDITPRSTPTAVLGGLSFLSIAPSNGAAIGLTPAGQAYGWGLNSDGGLGVGDVNPRSSPVAVLGGLVFTQVFCSVGSSYGLTASGALYAWGTNNNGQLGVGDVLPRSTPTAVLGGLSFASVVVSGSGSTSSTVVGLTSAGVAYAWGLNNGGQLGVGDTAPRSSPVAVLGGLNFSSIYTSGGTATYGVGISTAPNFAGLLYAWGNNQFGRLGTNDITSRSSPVAVSMPTQVNIATRITTPLIISVVPGTSYVINVNGGVATFGNTEIAGGAVASMILEYYP